MANDKDIRIGITTQADTTGADRTVTAIDRVLGIEQRRKQSADDFLTAAEAEAAEVDRLVSASRRLEEAREAEALATKQAAEAMRQEQAQLDVLEAKRRVAARGAQANAAATQNFGNVVTQVGFQVTDFATQVSSGTSAFVALAQQAPQAIGAVQQLGQGMKLSFNSSIGLGTGIGIAATAVAISGQIIAQKYSEMKAAIDAAAEAEKNLSEQLNRNAQLRKELAERNRADFITESFAKDAEALERQVKALERINELRGVQGESAAAQAAAAVTIAKNTGGDVTGAKANAIAIGVDNQLDALESKLSSAEAALASAVQDFDQKRLLLAEATRLSGGVDTQQSFDAAQAAAASENAVNEAKAALENLKAIAAAQRAAIEAGAAASISELGAELNTSIEEKTKEFVAGAKTNIDAVVEASGPRLAADAKGAIDRFQNLINDTIPDSQQLDAITATVRQFRGSQSTMLSGLTENFDALLKQSGGIMTELARQKSDIASLRSQLDQLLGL